MKVQMELLKAVQKSAPDNRAVAKKYWLPPMPLAVQLTGVELKRLENELKITRHWFEWVGLILIFPILLSGHCWIGSQVISGLNSSQAIEMRTLLSLVVMTVVVALLDYIGLLLCFNRTMIRVSPQNIEVKYGPFPYPGMRSQVIDSNAVHQIQVVCGAFWDELRVISGKQRQQITLLRLPSQVSALYLEEEIAQYLGLPLATEPMPDPYDEKLWAEVRHFAEIHQLDFKVSKFLRAPVLSGNYQGYLLEISFFKWNYGADQSRTRLLLSTTKSKEVPTLTLEQPSGLLQVDQLLDWLAPEALKINLSGTIKIEDRGKHLFYEEPALQTEANALGRLGETLLHLLEIYPGLINLGGVAIPALQTLAARVHPFQPVAVQLLHDIAWDTRNRLKKQSTQFICASCFHRCQALKIKLPDTQSFTYYGCRACGQSQEFLTVPGSVVAMLDEQMAEHYHQEGDRLYANWLRHRQPFDFDEIHIRQASDEAVERFVVQMGNDTDPVRRPRYATMRCLIWPDCGLSENSLKILQRTLGQVEQAV